MKRIALFCPRRSAGFDQRVGAGAGRRRRDGLARRPANLREGATAIKWKPDFTYDTLKKRHKPSGLLRPDGLS